MEKTPSHIPTGGLIWLQARVTDPDLIAWLVPGWAALCGVIASDGLGGRWLRLALLILLVDGGWGTLWGALTNTDWLTPLRRWRKASPWQACEPVGALPYTLPHSPAGRAARWLGQLRNWWREELRPTHSAAVSAVIVALPVTLVLGMALGPRLLLLSLAALAVMQMGLVWKGDRAAFAPGWDAVVSVMLPWLAGHVAFGALTPRSIALATAFALAWGGSWRTESLGGRLLTVGGQTLAAALLISAKQPLAAGASLLLLFPQMILLPWLRRGQSISWYVRHARPWLMAAMLIAAWAL